MSVRLARAELRPEGWRVGVVTALSTLAAALCLQPLLQGAWWLPPSAIAVAVVAASGFALRVFDAPLPLRPLIQCAALIGCLTTMFARDEATWGFPGPAALGRLQLLVAQGREYALGTPPPAGPNAGLLLLIVGGVGLTALAADSLSGGLELPTLTLLPLSWLFAVPWWISRGATPAWTFVVVALAWLAVLAASQRERTATWGHRARPGAPGLGAAVAVSSIGVALLVGGQVATRMPSAASGSGSVAASADVRLDAMVSLRRSLLADDTRQVLAFTTTAEVPDYLRLAVLEEFDGVDWFPAATTVLGEQAPTRPAASPGSGATVEYVLDLGPLAGATVPSPPGARASVSGFPVLWDQRTGLPIRADGSTVQGTTVRLTVVPPEGRPKDLSTAAWVGRSGEQGFEPEDLADPEPLTGPELPGLAREIARGAANPYEAAMALQRWFTTDGGFTYSTAAAPGSGQEALEAFLEERTGYCEQFAATMALMARSLGIPARVVVGFTQGQPSDGRWVVRGTDAHAWPELWMGPAGWLRFEPTPGATTTTTPAYSAPEASTDQDGATDERSVRDPTGATQGPSEEPDEEAALPPASSTSSGVLSPWVLMALVSTLLMAPMIVRVVRRHRRLRRGDADSAYREVVDTAIDLGLAPEGATPRMTMSAIAAALVDHEHRLAAQHVRDAVEAHRYGLRAAPLPAQLPGSRATRPGNATESPCQTLTEAARELLTALRRSVGLRQRMLAALTPRSLLTPRSAAGRPA